MSTIEIIMLDDLIINIIIKCKINCLGLLIITNHQHYFIWKIWIIIIF